MIEKILDWVETWKNRGYPYDLPDEAPEVLEKENKVPSYRRICLAIMKNDTQLISLGYERQPCRSYSILKRIELILRGKIKSKHEQMRLFK